MAFRADHALRDALQAAADSDRRTLSDMLRLWVVDHLEGRKARGAPEPGKQWRQLDADMLKAGKLYEARRKDPALNEAFMYLTRASAGLPAVRSLVIALGDALRDGAAAPSARPSRPRARPPKGPDRGEGGTE